MTGAGTFVFALAVALAATPAAAAVARRFEIVDRPGPLKVHSRSVPYLGGVAVFAAMAGPIAVERAALLIPLALLVALGFADDRAGMAPTARLLGEIAIGFVAGAIAPASGRFGILLTAIFVVGLVNAVNLLDGLDGLAGGVVLASAFGFAALGGPGGIPALALAGALAGFLWFNRPPARIYLGDSGAYLCGGALALLAALALDDRSDGAAWAAIPLLVAIPVFDTAVAIVRRRRWGRPMLAGDRSHVYDQLVDRGQSPAFAVLECIAAQVVFCTIGVLAASWATNIAVLVTTICVALLVSIATWGGFLSQPESSR